MEVNFYAILLFLSLFNLLVSSIFFNNKFGDGMIYQSRKLYPSVITSELFEYIVEDVRSLINQIK